jgi:hypothetical protein
MQCSEGQRETWRRTLCLAPTWPLFASIRPGSAPGAWHRFSRLFASIRPGADLAAYLLASDLAPRLVPGTDFAARGHLFASI